MNPNMLPYFAFSQQASDRYVQSERPTNGDDSSDVSSSSRTPSSMPNSRNVQPGPYLSSDLPLSLVDAAVVAQQEHSGQNKVERRRARERESARRSRRRKKELLEGLEQRVSRLQSENQELRRKLQASEGNRLQEIHNALITNLERLVVGNGPESDINETVMNVRDNLAEKRVAVRRTISELQQILEPVRRADAILWLLLNLGSYDRDEEIDYHDSVGEVDELGIPIGPVPGFFARTELQEVACEDGGVMVVERMRPVLDPTIKTTVEIANHICRRILAAVRMSRSQRMQLHMFAQTHRDITVRMKSQHKEISALTERLDELRRQHEVEWSALESSLNAIHNSFNPSQNARLHLWIEQHSELLNSLLAYDSSALARNFAPASTPSPAPPPSLAPAQPSPTFFPNPTNLIL
mmetsp:Transcript_43858/g.71322  ORF Transcript_43858/g.71322 Transcript_43858/m.71322 type:complete len:410 (-) Transcript_43858:220-1449(-)